MRVRLIFSSTMILPRIGIAVIDIAAAMKSARFSQLPLMCRVACIQRPSRKPRLKGKIMPAMEMDMAVPRLLLRCPKSNSRPIRNINKMSPIWLMIVKICPTEGLNTA